MQRGGQRASWVLPLPSHHLPWESHCPTETRSWINGPVMYRSWGFCINITCHCHQRRCPGTDGCPSPAAGEGGGGHRSVTRMAVFFNHCALLSLEIASGVPWKIVHFHLIGLKKKNVPLLRALKGTWAYSAFSASPRLTTGQGFTLSECRYIKILVLPLFH